MIAATAFATFILLKRTPMQNNSSKNFLTFTKKEKRGIIVILTLVLAIFICSKYVYPFIAKDKTISSATTNTAIDSLKQKATSKNDYAQNDGNDEANYQSYSKKNYNTAFTGTMFYFDPNSLDATGWKKLGIKDKTIASIQNYLSKGGKFRSPEDLRKVWGFTEAEKDRLVPYAHIATPENGSINYKNSYPPYEKKTFEKKAIAVIDINAGDSAAFVDLPGIGPGFSKRIINFRNKLGGFYKVEQVAETFGLPDSTFQKIKPYLKIDGNNIRQININTATNDELKAHPYIRWQLANVITEYKKQHGNFKVLEDLKKIMIIDAETYSKISPYLTL